MRKVSSEPDTILSETAGSGGNVNQSEVGAYYKEMLKLDPSNSLVLANYSRFLHQVEGDMVKAEEYYGKAILESPEDGEVLSLYGTLIWETHRDQYRAHSYFDQALHASLHDCTVLGSYAHFMWEAEEEDGGDSKIEREN
ncbi:uncharacterized protein LOC131333723 [Rhododendron vialii]|uniref:uncharacterized protein LOC131333723 n=1 Tax=Rhododendron vialii TaxID=182163 RepID=UPI00265EC497|nr:uncharacterized protein LOC131333723 [Rhododendron vialii]